MMKRAHILIVEDEPVLYKRLKMLLKEHKYAVDEFTPSVDEALSRIKIKRPNLVLLDIELEGEKTGIDLGRILYNEFKIPFIYITSHNDDQTFFESISTNHEQFIVKTKLNLNETEVLRAVQTALHRNKNNSPFYKEGLIGLVDYLSVIKEANKGEVTRVPVDYKDIVFFTVKPFVNENGKLENLKDNYLWFQTIDEDYYFLRSSLLDIEPQLPQYFVRINDSQIVNISLKMFNGRVNGSRLSILKKEFTISDRYKQEVKKQIEILYD